jgi:hypothetical protein
MSLAVARRLAWRSVTHRPWRLFLLCLGYGFGVAVMVVLLAVGEAMVAQASRERLVGGGEVTVLPDGIDVEVLTTGGLGGLFFSVPNARFVYRQVLAAPRNADVIATVAPQLEGKLLYLRLADGRELPVRASGEVPSRSRALGAVPDVIAGAWEDDDGDRRWAAPTPAELRHDTDHFHVPPASVADRSAWGEWHYVNVLAPDASQWVFLSFIVGGDVTGDRWGGQVLVTVHERGRAPRRFNALVPAADVRFATDDADLMLGPSRVTVEPDGRYRVVAVAREEGTGVPLRAELLLAPAPGAEFPGTTLASGDFTSGYAVAALRGEVSGTVCVAGACRRYDRAQGYHDHNWGVWRGVSWDWGATRAGAYAVLYGRVAPDDTTVGEAPLFAYVTDSLGFTALFRPRAIRYDDAHVVMTADGPLRVPATAELFDVRGRDTLRLRLAIDDAVATDTRRAAAGRGETDGARALARPWFVQMAGTAAIGGRLRGRPLSGTGRGFFETYR